MRPLLALFLVVAAGPALAQKPAPRPTVVPPPELPAPPIATPAAPRVAPSRAQIGPRRLGGPRTGVTILSAAAVESINDAFDLNQYCYPYEGHTCEASSPRVDPSFPVVTQFGWQYERRMFQAASGLTGVTEWVLLVGGAERGLLLPSATFLAGVRTPGGFEVGVGPNLSLSGAAYALTVGKNTEIGEVNIPVNAAVVFGQDGPRLSLLVGFNVTESRY